METHLGCYHVQRPNPTTLCLFGCPPPPPPCVQVLNLLNNIASRKFEFQADAFGVGLGKGEALREALLVLDKENKVGGWVGGVLRAVDGHGCLLLLVCMEWGGEGRENSRSRQRAPPPADCNTAAVNCCRCVCCRLVCAVQGAVNTDKLYCAYHYSHPPLVERLAAIDAGMKKDS